MDSVMHSSVQPKRDEDLVVLAQAREKLRNNNLQGAWERLMIKLDQEVKIIKEQGEKYINYSDVANGTVPKDQIDAIKKRGVFVIKNTVPKEQAEKWAQQAVEYLSENNYNNSKAKSDDPKDFFSGTTPQIYGVKPQMEARQHNNMQVARSFIASLWSNKISDSEIAFDPTKEATYADRMRVRTPGNISGLIPHVDGGSVEGKWEEYNAFNGVDRVNVEELPFPNVCTIFRISQGWLAVSTQGEGDGTLQTVPLLAESTSYILMRPFLNDVTPENPLCGALTGVQHQFTNKQWHGPLLEGLVSIPKVEAGDTVWWHPDIIHAVEREHKGVGNSSVFYIGAAPLCQKNAKYLASQKQSFIEGEAGPDFPQEGREKDYSNRAQVSDLSDLGKRQMGFKNWDVKDDDNLAVKSLINECNQITK